MITLRNVQKSFGGIKAIKGSTFSVKKGQITALIGPNGAGKTTLFNMICGFMRPDEGSIRFHKHDLTTLSTHRIAQAGVSRTFQQVRLFSQLSIADHFHMAEQDRDMSFWKNMWSAPRLDYKQYDEECKHLGIDRDSKALAGELSYGQKKLLEIGMALRKPHSILLLDEPVAGVNAVLQDRIEHMLMDLKKQGETILLIDHDMNFIRKLADHVIALDSGVVIAEGSPKEVLSNRDVLTAYLGD